MRTTIYVVLLCMSGISNLNAQFFNKVIDRATDKIADRAADKLAEKIADMAMRPINSAIDSMIRTNYENDSINGTLTVADYESFLSGLDKSEAVPASYSFDIMMEMETTDKGGDKSRSKMYYTQSGDHLGIENEDQFFVWDMKNDIMVNYNQKDNSAFAISSMMNSKWYAKAVEDHFEPYTLEKTGKTKKIAGYTCDQYKGENSEEKIEFYAAQEFPITWQSATGAMMKQFAPESYFDKLQEIEGMILRSEQEDKDSGKRIAKWETKKVEEKTTELLKSDYAFKPMTDQ